MSKLLKLIYSNKLFCFLMMLAQFVILILMGFWLNDYYRYFYITMTALSAILILYEVNRDEEPGFKITWIMLIAIIPIFGALLYIFLHFNGASKRIANNSVEVRTITSEYTKQDKDVLKNLDSEAKIEVGTSNYIYENSKFPVYRNSSIKYFSLGDYYFEALKADLRKAEKFIFIETFIINPNGKMWPEIMEILKEKARSGVEVRLMYDGMGCMNLLPSDYSQQVEKFGIKCRIFAPIVPFFSTYQNNRDHRKILIIDGKLAYNGGTNYADEYINEIVRFGHWKDNVIRINGAAVSGFTSMFLQMWNISLGKIKNDDYGVYINAVPQDSFEEGEGYIIPFADSPLLDDRFGENMYINILNNAQSYVHIMTPYLVIGTNMIHALKFAAKRGVDVKLMLPHIPDKPYAFWLAGTYYAELIESGVEIYEYTPGFLHSKMSVSDDCRAIIGTINHDYRSFYLHYECASYLINVPEIAEMEKDFSETLLKCEKITIENYMERSFFTRFAGAVIRLIAPLL